MAPKAKSVDALDRAQPVSRFTDLGSSPFMTARQAVTGDNLTALNQGNDNKRRLTTTGDPVQAVKRRHGSVDPF